MRASLSRKTHFVEIMVQRGSHVHVKLTLSLQPGHRQALYCCFVVEWAMRLGCFKWKRVQGPCLEVQSRFVLHFRDVLSSLGTFQSFDDVESWINVAALCCGGGGHHGF